MNMGKNKPRHNLDKPQNKFKYCAYDDSTVDKECGFPWANKCQGDMYKCKKLYLQHLATLTPEKRGNFTEKYERIQGHPFGVPRTNYQQLK